MTRRHIDDFLDANPGGLNDSVIQNLYKSWQPVRSGPLSASRILCVLLEEIAKNRGIELPPPAGLKKK